MRGANTLRDRTPKHERDRSTGRSQAKSMMMSSALLGQQRPWSGIKKEDPKPGRRDQTLSSEQYRCTKYSAPRHLKIFGTNKSSTEPSTVLVSRHRRCKMGTHQLETMAESTTNFLIKSNQNYQAANASRSEQSKAGTGVKQARVMTPNLWQLSLGTCAVVRSECTKGQSTSMRGSVLEANEIATPRDMSHYPKANISRPCMRKRKVQAQALWKEYSSKEAVATGQAACQIARLWHVTPEAAVTKVIRRTYQPYVETNASWSRRSRTVGW